MTRRRNGDDDGHTGPHQGRQRLHTHGNERTRLRQGRRRLLHTRLNEDDLK
jgi:hypothetical protein